MTAFGSVDLAPLQLIVDGRRHISEPARAMWALRLVALPVCREHLIDGGGVEPACGGSFQSAVGLALLRAEVDRLYLVKIAVPACSASTGNFFDSAAESDDPAHAVACAGYPGTASQKLLVG